MAVIKTTSFSESNFNTSTNTSTLTINPYFSANNQVTWFQSATLYCTCNGITQSKNVSHPVGGSVNASFTFNNILHNSDGNKSVNWNWSCATGTSTLGTITDSGTKQLTKINRASIFNTSAWNSSEKPIEEAITLPITKYVSSYYHKLLVGTLQNQYIIERDGVENGYSFQFTTDELNNTIYPLMTTNTKTITFKLLTYTDNTMTSQVGDYSTVFYIGTITNANPIFSNFVYEDSNNTTLLLTGNNQSIVNKYSNLKITISDNNKAVGQKKSTIEYYKINDIAYPYADNFTQTINNYSMNNVTIYAIDNRGNSTSISKVFTTFIDYKESNISTPDLDRTGGIDEETTLSFDGSWWNSSFGFQSNTISATYQYKEKGTDTYINGSSILSLTTDTTNNLSINQTIKGDLDTGFDTQKTFDVKVILTDKINNYSFYGSVAVGSPAIDIYGNNISLGGSYNEVLGGRVQINGELPGGIHDSYNTSTTDTYSCNYINSIIESGNNSNGNWIKYENGIMICTIAKGVSFSTYSQDGSIYYYDITNIEFPQTFNNLYSVDINYCSSKTGNMPWCSCINSSVNSIERIRLYNYYNASNSTGMLYITAIGKWK